MRLFSKLFAISILISLSLNAFSQIGITGYSVYALGVNTSQAKKISVELKAFTNNIIDNMLTEADIFYNFKEKPYHRFAVGVGVNAGLFRGFDLINSFTVPLDLEIFPIQDLKQFSVVIEVSPEFVIDGDVGLTQLWGIRYTFGHNKE